MDSVLRSSSRYFCLKCCFNRPQIFPLGLLREKTLEGWGFFQCLDLATPLWYFPEDCSSWPWNREGVAHGPGGTKVLQSPWHAGSGVGVVVRGDRRKGREEGRGWASHTKEMSGGRKQPECGDGDDCEVSLRETKKPVLGNLGRVLGSARGPWHSAVVTETTVFMASTALYRILWGLHSSVNAPLKHASCSLQVTPLIWAWQPLSMGTLERKTQLANLHARWVTGGMDPVQEASPSFPTFFDWKLCF